MAASKRVIYLDNASTSWPKAPNVASTMADYLNTEAANPGRGAHAMALASEKMIGDARALIANLLNAEAPERIVFGLNASDALNTAIFGVVDAASRDSDTRPHVVSTYLEHNSIRRPLNSLEQRGIIELTRVEADANGLLCPDAIASAVKPNTVLVAFTHASNVLGAVQPLPEIVKAVRQTPAGESALVLTDSSQTVGAVPIDVQECGVDLLAAPGHKGLLGPTGTGLLYVSPRAYDPDRTDDGRPIRMVNFKSGGTGTDSATPTQPVELPVYFEAGTPNTVGIAGLAAGVRYVVEHGVEQIWDHEQRLVRQLADLLSSDSRITLHGCSSHNDSNIPRVGLLSITVAGVDPGEASAWLDATYGVAVRPGLHCAPGAHESTGTFPAGTIRISPGPFTTEQEIEIAARAVREMADSMAV
ncbi:MAG: aminotransferase class V-fold PLP-dependent enzyme [Planctomycetes bacterium]|nr:aminotransferase class V-fold PLP-dependent enzyme [Planctomycetota bacterium]NOG53078.1 aminotransferase class V-fold PLP-dependent enzyme [Planctomycetota bacterium]